jgi:hypothetical protein
MLRSRATPLDALPPIGLAELDACAALRDRVDVKYVAGTDVLPALAELLAPTHRALEIGGRRTFAYATTYFDTPELGSYRDHLQRRRRRFKCRVRSYLDAGADVLEVKARGARGATVKSRLALPAPVAALDRALHGFVRARVRETCGREPGAWLEPVLAMRFERMTLVAPEAGERLTCDVGLAFRGPARGARLAAGAVILESKSRAGTAVADAVLRRLGVRPVTGCSKYCLGIALTRPGVTANPYRRLLRRHFEEIA